jgi:galactokinase
MTDLLTIDPVPTLRERVAGELSALFIAGRPIRYGRSPGRLDVMGGIADASGGMVCQMTLDGDGATAVALQDRDDRLVQVFSFNLLDQQLPFTLTISLDDLGQAPIAALRRNFNEPGRAWGAYLVGCLAILQDEGLIDLRAEPLNGMNLACLSNAPAGRVDVVALTVATMTALLDHLSLREGPHASLDIVRVAGWCRRVVQDVAGAACDVKEPLTCLAGRRDALTRVHCQPTVLLEPLALPTGIRMVGIDTGGPVPDSQAAYGRCRCAAFMAHRIILEEMRRFGQEAGRELIADPMNGHLANLDADDYKRLFRGRLAESMKGSTFIDRFGQTSDAPSCVEADVTYAVQFAADHHVLEARRVREFVRYLQAASERLITADARRLNLDKSGHLMYASHKSYAEAAVLSVPDGDVLVDLVRKNERAGGLYGARLTDGGRGGVVAVLCDKGPHSDAMLDEIVSIYEQKTGKAARWFEAGGTGAWQAATGTGSG